jgi:hypothetical protein
MDVMLMLIFLAFFHEGVAGSANTLLSMCLGG